MARAVVATAAALLTLTACGGPDHTVSAGLGGRTDATLDIVSGVGAVTIRSADIGTDLYRVSTPDDSGVLPAVTLDGDHVRVGTQSAGRGGPPSLDVRLASGVRWRLHMDAGATEQAVDMRGGHLAALDLAAGVTRSEAWLPRPAGVVTVRESGGASELTLHVPDGVPVRLRLGGGAATASVDGKETTGVSGGTVLTTADWQAAPDRYEVVTSGGVSTLSLDRA